MIRKLDGWSLHLVPGNALSPFLMLAVTSMLWTVVNVHF